MSHSKHISESGQEIPSVSQIPAIYAHNLDGFEDWICKGLHPKEALCCTKAKREYYKEAANLGNDIHTLREAFLRGEDFATEGIPEYQAKVFEPIVRFYKESGYKPLQIGLSEGYNVQALELKLTGKEFGGTLDGAGKFENIFWEGRKQFWDKKSLEFPGIDCEPAWPKEAIWIEDLKIKSKIDPLHPLQLYGYSLLLKECYNIDAKWGLIIRREKKLDKRPEIQLKGYYLPAYAKQWEASLLMWKFLND